jgi:threonine/homoserine/homoserine lactone efflux protein
LVKQDAHCGALDLFSFGYSSGSTANFLPCYHSLSNAALATTRDLHQPILLSFNQAKSMIEPTTFLLFAAASAAVVIVPGPTVTVIIANSLRSGIAAGLMNVAGTQLGLALMLLVLAFGFASIVEQMSTVFEVIRLIGAAYLIWLGINLWRANGALADAPKGKQKPMLMRGYFAQGFLVIWSNPKALFFFGAFIPQFVNPAYDPLPQVLLFGATFMAIATLLDGAYAVAAGKAGDLLTRGKISILEKVSGSCLIGGGLWLAFDRR